MATHEDPTHGVAPHSVAYDPANVHPVDISTPHPYEDGNVYTYEIQASDPVEGAAESLSVHFENTVIDGYYSSWSGCNGDWLNITDGNTGDLLDSWCGNAVPAGYDGDFWTDDYPTDHVVITLDTTEDAGTANGFDIYEAVSDGAQVAYTTHNAWGEKLSPSVSVTSLGTSADVDPYADDPSEDAGASATVQPEGYVANLQTDTYVRVEVGEWDHCEGWSCHSHSGIHVQTFGEQGSDEWLTVYDSDGNVLFDGKLDFDVDIGTDEDDESPIGVTVHEPECTIEGDGCNSYIPGSPQ